MAKPFKDGVDQGRRVMPSGKTSLSVDASTTLPWVCEISPIYSFLQPIRLKGRGYYFLSLPRKRRHHVRSYDSYVSVLSHDSYVIT